MSDDTDPKVEPSAADAAPPALWETVASVRLDGAQAVHRSTTARTPSCGVAVSH